MGNQKQDRDMTEAEKAERRYGTGGVCPSISKCCANNQQVWSRRGSVVVAEKTKNAQGSGKHMESMVCRKGMERAEQEAQCKRGYQQPKEKEEKSQS